MKELTLISWVILPLLVLGLTSCANENDYSVEKTRVYVSSQTDFRKAFFDNLEIDEECMLLKEDEESDLYRYLKFNEIVGFTYEKGYEYVLEVRKTWVSDSSGNSTYIQYELIKIISKTLK